MHCAYVVHIIKWNIVFDSQIAFRQISYVKNNITYLMEDFAYNFHNDYMEWSKNIWLGLKCNNLESRSNRK